MKFCVYDIETIPNQSLSEDMKSEFAKTVKAGNLGPEKAQEKIDKKMSLDPDLCEVVCFTGQQPTGKIYTYLSTDVFPTLNDTVCPNAIETAWSFIHGYYFDHIPLVSFNGIQFDLPVLWHQAMKHDIPVSAQMYSDLTKKYDNRYHYDLLQLLSGWDRTKYKSLDFYLKLFNIGEKVGEGSEIYGWWQTKEYDKIREHCEADVKATAQLFERLATYIVKEV